MLCTTKMCEKSGRETSPSATTKLRNERLSCPPHPAVAWRFSSLVTREKPRTCDAWETLHAAVAAPAPSPNAFAVEKHASAAAATQIRLYMSTKEPRQDAFD